MKTNKLLLIATVMLAALLFSSPNSFAQVIDEGEEIDVTMNNSGPNQSGNRLPVVVPIRVTYYSQSTSVEVLFTSNLGDVTVVIENTDTAEYHSYLVDSSLGGDSFLISGDPGHYTITFTLANGTEYIGEWEI
jgi:hypothetical protein